MTFKSSLSIVTSFLLLTLVCFIFTFVDVLTIGPVFDETRGTLLTSVARVALPGGWLLYLSYYKMIHWV